MLKKYEVIKEQIESGVVESASFKATVGEVAYTPHWAVVRSDRKSMKVRYFFLTPAQKGIALMNV